MDLNVKKLAAGAGLLFTRAVQFTGEKLGQAEKTELDAHYENLMSRADCTKNWTEKICRQTEVLLQPNPIDHTGARIEEFLYEKLDRKAPSRVTNGELLGHYMEEAAKEFGPDTPYGSRLLEVGGCERRLGTAERELLHTSALSFLTPLRNFLEGDWRTIAKERRLLENLRLDLDAAKARLKKAKAAEAKAAMAPDFQETRPRNYVLSASASAVRRFCLTTTNWKFTTVGENRKRTHSSSSKPTTVLYSHTVTRVNWWEGECRVQVVTWQSFFFFPACHPVPMPPCRPLWKYLWSDEVEKAEHELRVARTDFDRQAEVTRLLLEGIGSTHVNHLRCLHEFVEAQATYYKQCHCHMQELKTELGRHGPFPFAKDAEYDAARWDPRDEA
ncbi:endophilin-B2-like isoform X2 [Phycodurus eques]|uniref:endophilin-B2-like isoform X2 n=1 Tax=Phycodurus eques TaxID=693459 RepID=UPI002ACE6E7A|nr:endophilin-B2-like isoform X2 [Phycodurus eques]